MQITNLALAYSLLELKPLLENNIISKIQELENTGLKVRLRSGKKDLILAPNLVFFSSFSMPAKQQSSGFGGFLKKHLSGKKILKLEQHGLDRILVLEFNDYFLVLELFAKGNIILTDKKMEILGVLRNEQWKDRTLRKGREYIFPASKGLNPKEISFGEFEKAVLAQGSDIVHALIQALNIAPVVAEACLSELGIPKDSAAKNISKKQFEKIFEKILEYYSMKKALLKPVLAQTSSGQALLPFSLRETKTIAEFDSLNSALESLASNPLPDKKQQGLEKKIAELEKSIEQQKASKEKFGKQIELNRKKAEAIYAHYAEIQNAFSLLRELKSEKTNKKDIMYKLNSLVFVKGFDVKNSRLMAEFE